MEWIEKGGPFMWPILLCSLISVYCLIDRILHFALHVPRVNRDLDLLSRGRKQANRPAGHLAPVLNNALAEKQLDETLAEQAIERDLQDAENRLSALNLIAQVTPLLGLLGTVTGLIRAFRAMQFVQGQLSPETLAAGVWEALVNTAAGLMVAIPALAAYMYFTNIVSRWENRLVGAKTEVQNVIAGRPGLESV